MAFYQIGFVKEFLLGASYEVSAIKNTFNAHWSLLYF